MRADDLRVERAAVAATELSLARCAELYLAVPVVDHGADLLAYQADPFRVARIQVKGATGGLPVYCADLPGDQLTGTLPVEVHAGRSELLQEYVDLVVEPRTSRHVASLPSSHHGARLHPNGRWR